MTDPATPKPHDLQELWKAQSETQKEVGQMSGDIVGLKTSVTGLQTSMTELLHEVRGLAVPKPFNVGWLVAVIVMVSTGIGLYVIPTQRQADENARLIMEAINKRHDDALVTERRLATLEERSIISGGKVERMDREGTRNSNYFFNREIPAR